jgi:hypothetical protein
MACGRRAACTEERLWEKWEGWVLTQRAQSSRRPAGGGTRRDERKGQTGFLATGTRGMVAWIGGKVKYLTGNGRISGLNGGFCEANGGQRKVEERFLAAWADIIAGAMMREKASAHFARNDGWDGTGQSAIAERGMLARHVRESHHANPECIRCCRELRLV